MEIGFKEVRDIVQDVVKPTVDDTFVNMATAKIGDGISSLHADRSGIWLGANSFADAPFSVDMEGNVTLRRILALTGYKTSEEIELEYNTAITLSREEIELQASETYGPLSLVTTLTQTARDLEIKVGRSGGSNIIKNSSGLKTSLLGDWGVTESGTVFSTKDSTYGVDANTESRSGIVIANNTITQTLQTIPNEHYIFRCRFRRNALTYLTMGGIFTSMSISTVGYANDTWATFIKEFTAISNTIVMTITNAASYCVIADMICKKKSIETTEDEAGIYDIPWEQAPNETYGTGFQFDVEGLHVSNTDSTLVNTVDNEGMKVRNEATNKDVMRMTGSEGLVSDLVAQNSFKVQNYDDPVDSFRILTTTDGVMFVIDE